MIPDFMEGRDNNESRGSGMPIKLLGYAWAAVLWIAAARALDQGYPAIAAVYALGGLVGFPPIWKAVKARMAPETGQAAITPSTSEKATMLGWGAAVTLALIALPFVFSTNLRAIAVALLMGALIALPPLWKRLHAGGLLIPDKIRAAGVLAAVVLAAWVWDDIFTPGEMATSPQAAEAASGDASPTEPEPTAEASRLADLRDKVDDGAVLPMTADQFPDARKKLGQARFGAANELAPWAALAAAESDMCPRVALVGVSDRATRNELRYYVDCSNGERFNVTEPQIAALRAKLDPAANETTTAMAEGATAIAPVSARWDKFDAAAAITSCDLLTQSTLTDQRSFDSEFRWEESRNAETGIVQFERGFTAKAYLGTMNSRYRCSVNADTGRVTALSIREAGGWKKLL